MATIDAEMAPTNGQLRNSTSSLVEGIKQAHGDSADEPGQTDQNARTASSIFQIKSLHLICFRILDLLSNIGLALFDLDRLGYLTLESCFPRNCAFNLLAFAGGTSESSWKPRLKGFAFRHEGQILDLDMQSILRSFFEGFTGLVHLSVLLEGPNPVVEPSCFIEHHGPSLQTLVWDQRTEARTELDVVTHSSSDTALAQDSDQIVNGCPNLKELGILMATRGDGGRKSYKVRTDLIGA